MVVEVKFPNEVVVPYSTCATVGLSVDHVIVAPIEPTVVALIFEITGGVWSSANVVNEYKPFSFEVEEAIFPEASI